MPRKQEKRNGHAFHPIMRKGGVHEKTEKAKRKAAKHQLNRKVQEWLGRSSFIAPIGIIAGFPTSSSHTKHRHIC